MGRRFHSDSEPVSVLLTCMGEEGMEEDVVLVFVLLSSEGQSGRRSLLKLLGLCLQLVQ